MDGPADHTRELEFATALAKYAGELIWGHLERCGAQKTGADLRVLVKENNPSDLVTAVDLQTERMIVEKIQAAFPGHRIIGEEGTAASWPPGLGPPGELLTDDWTWIIDPIDGTTNFVHGFPMVAVCIALAHNREVVVGVVQEVCQHRTFYASKGRGAFCHDNKKNTHHAVRVSQTTEIQRAVIGAEFGSDRSEAKIENVLFNINRLVTGKTPCHAIRSLGSAALNMVHVALGGMDAYFEFGIHVWDYAAASRIVLEAGGHVSSFVISPATVSKEAYDARQGSCELAALHFDLLARNVVCAASLPLLHELAGVVLPYNQPREAL